MRIEVLRSIALCVLAASIIRLAALPVGSGLLQ
jgi:hypothetical protein